MNTMPELLQAVLDTSSASAYSIDRDYRYTSFNTSYAEGVRLFRGTRIERGRRMHDHLGATWDGKHLLERAMAGESFRDTFMVANRHFEVACSALPERVGSGVAVFAIEVTRRKQAEETLWSVEKQLRAAHKLESLGRLAKGVAHDLNNLLTIILSTAEFATRTGASIDLLEDIRTASSRAAKVVQQFLLASSAQGAAPVLIEVNKLLHDTARLLRPTLGANMTLNLTLDPSHSVIHADQSQIEQVLINLVLNARDAMPNGGTIEVSAQARDLTVLELTVKDSGHGMSAEVKARAFEPFFTTKPPGKGTGLGLPLVYEVVHSLGGQIVIDSEPGAGTTIRIQLPLAR
jgi:signal transduction histidine kinase